MKNTIMAEPLRFPKKDRIALILGLFFPAWLGIFLGFVVVLNLLPMKIARKLSPQPIHIVFVILGSLVIIAIIAIVLAATGKLKL